MEPGQCEGDLPETRTTSFFGVIPVPGEQPIDLSNSNWITNLKPGMKLTITSNGKTYTITGDGKTALLNKFEVTVEQWEKLLEGEPITLPRKSGSTITMQSEFDPSEKNGFFNHLKFGQEYMFGIIYNVKIVYKTPSERDWRIDWGSFWWSPQTKGQGCPQKGEKGGKKGGCKGGFWMRYCKSL